MPLSPSLEMTPLCRRLDLTAPVVQAPVVSSDRLIDALWGEVGSEDGAKALSVAVSRLRKLLEPERSRGEAARTLLTRPPGYVLRLGEDELDLHRFERLVADSRTADPATAAALLCDALALWRGPPLADLAYESFAQAEIARLEESRLAALEHRIEAAAARRRPSWPPRFRMPGASACSR
jgi:DNA-binding SARP family transcriptional activator